MDWSIPRPINMCKRGGIKANIIYRICWKSSIPRKIFPMRGETINYPKRITFHYQWAKDGGINHISFNNTKEFVIIHRKITQVGTTLAKRGIPKWFLMMITILIFPWEKATSILTFNIPWVGGFQKRLEDKLGPN